MKLLTKANEEQLLDLFGNEAMRPYVKSTNGIEISVWPEFIDGRFNNGSALYIWAYHVRIDNNSNNIVKLESRYWRILDEKGNLQEVRGEGVVGQQPIIAPGASHQYSSGVHLKYPSGIMSGNYQMRHIASELENEGSGEVFSVEIPAFSLDVPTGKKVVN